MQPCHISPNLAIMTRCAVEGEKGLRFAIIVPKYRLDVRETGRFLDAGCALPVSRGPARRWIDKSHEIMLFL